MRFLTILFILLIVSCSSLSEQDKLRNKVTGNWLVMNLDQYPENKRQKKVYEKVQDSIETQNELKLVSFFEDGIFQQMDSLNKKGKWTITPYNEVYIMDGGKGFENFKTKLFDSRDGLLQLDEKMYIEGESIKLTWNLKKVKEPGLFGADNNAWRNKPQRPESAEEIKKRLSVMLNYYSLYFNVVNKESTYFIPVRVMLPFRYYQHAMGMGNYKPQSAFSNLFFDSTQSKQAYYFLENTIRTLRHDYPSGTDFIDEYASFMELMAKEIIRK